MFSYLHNMEEITYIGVNIYVYILPSRCQQEQGWWWIWNRTRYIQRCRGRIRGHQDQQNISTWKPPSPLSEAMISDKTPTFQFLLFCQYYATKIQKVKEKMVRCGGCLFLWKKKSYGRFFIFWRKTNGEPRKS